MLKCQSKAPTYRELRPVKGTGPTFPIYHDLVDGLVGVERGHYSELATHVCAVAAGWAYAESDTLAAMMARLGLEDSRCLQVSIANDAMFIASNAFLVQSACGRVAILCYRGTEPRNFINWLTDADVNPVKLPFPIGTQQDDGIRVHGGFYRNQRATWYQVVAALNRAVRGRSVLDAERDTETHPLEALYVTGHSLGAAMAALTAVRLVTDTAYRESFGARLRGVYTFGQPIVGNDAFAAACNAEDFLRDAVFRHVYGHDIVPRLPPTATGKFVHFGSELDSDPAGGWTPSEAPVSQVSEVLWSTFLVPALAFVAKQLERARDIDFPYSWYDHSPTFYIQCSTPKGIESEFER
jgi:hypothetical protein